MALLFQLGVECVSNRDKAVAIGAHFEGLCWTLSDGTVVRIGNHPEIVVDDDGNWWAGIAPSGLSRSGPRNESERAQMSEAGALILERLQSAPARYRYALVGVEISSMFQISGFPADLNVLAKYGLVLSEELWKRFESPSGFVPFSKGYWCVPFGGVPW